MNTSIESIKAHLMKEDFTLVKYDLDKSTIHLMDNDTKRIEVWYLREYAPACYNIKLPIEGKIYYAEFGYTPN